MLCGPEQVVPCSCGGCFMMASLDSCWMQNGRTFPSLFPWRQASWLMMGVNLPLRASARCEVPVFHPITLFLSYSSVLVIKPRASYTPKDMWTLAICGY